MLVVFFWIFTFVGLASIIAFIIGLFFKNMMFRKIVVVAFVISLLGIIITLKSCVDKVKDDFGYNPITPEEQLLEQEKREKELQKTKQNFDNAQHTFDSIKNKQLHGN